MNRITAYWIAWCVFAVVWTIGLTTQVSGPAFGDTEEMRYWSRIIIAKTAHFSIYCLWTIGTGWLRPPLRLRFFLLIFLMAHAVCTEWRQQYVPHRDGSLRDAAIDHLGIFLGVAISLRWWAAADRSAERAS